MFDNRGEQGDGNEIGWMEGGGIEIGTTSIIRDARSIFVFVFTD